MLFGFLKTYPKSAGVEPYAAASYAFLDRQQEAKTIFDSWINKFPFYPSTDLLYSKYPFRNSSVFDRLIEGLAKAGYKDSIYYSNKVDEKYKLSGSEIKDLLFDKK